MNDRERELIMRAQRGEQEQMRQERRLRAPQTTTDADMIRDPASWPLRSLPLKRDSAAHGGYDVAVAHPPRPDGTVVVDDVLEPMTTRIYRDADAVVEDGWMVD